MTLIQHIEPISVTQVHGLMTINLFPGDLVEVIWDPEILRVEKEHIVQMIQILRRLGGGVRMRVYVSTNDFQDVSTEAKRYVGTEEGQKYTLANAVLVDNLAKRLLYNFFIRFHAPLRPTRAFTRREDAFDWLLSIYE